MNNAKMPPDIQIQADPLIDEIRNIRRKISARFDNDVNRLIEHLREVEQGQSRPVIRPEATDIEVGNGARAIDKTKSAA